MLRSLPKPATAHTPTAPRFFTAQVSPAIWRPKRCNPTPRRSPGATRTLLVAGAGLTEGRATRKGPRERTHAQPTLSQVADSVYLESSNKMSGRGAREPPRPLTRAPHTPGTLREHSGDNRGRVACSCRRGSGAPIPGQLPTNLPGAGAMRKHNIWMFFVRKNSTNILCWV